MFSGCARTFFFLSSQDCLVRWFASGCFHRSVRTAGSSTEACAAERGSISSRLALGGLNVVADWCESDFTDSTAAHPTGLNYLCFCLPLSTNAVITHLDTYVSRNVDVTVILII